MNKSRTAAMACFAIGSVAVSMFGKPSVAEETDPAPVIEGRQANLRDLGAAFKAMGDELKKPQPALSSLRQHARQVDDLAKQQHFWFPAGSGPGGEVETWAKNEIWKRPQEFSAAQNAFAREAAKLLQVVGGDDIAAIKAQHRAVAKTCADCHDTFREEK